MGATLVYRTEAILDIEEEQGSNDFMKFAAAEMQGWRLNQEDTYIADVEFTAEAALFAVFDGHGGREVAVYCKEHYKQVLKDTFELIEEEDEEEWLRRSFLAMDVQIFSDEGQEEIAKLRRENPPEKSPMANMIDEQNDKKDLSEMTNEELKLNQIGCTANVVYVDYKNQKIFVANSGDSRCVAGVGGKAMDMSRDHKTTSKIEIDRIQKAGSTIAEGRVDGGLNLTRALGDQMYKSREELEPEEQAITANPDTYEFGLYNNFDFVIMGCDGIWEKKSNKEMIEYIYGEIAKYKSDGQAVNCQEIINKLLLETVAPDIKAGEQPGCDNMTCVLMLFEKEKFQAPPTHFDNVKQKIGAFKKRMSGIFTMKKD